LSAIPTKFGAGLPSQPVRRPYVLLIAIFVAWGTIPVVLSHIPISASAQVFARVWLASAGLGVVIAFRSNRGLDRARPALASHRPWLVAFAAAVLALHWVAEFSAYKHAPAGTVILIVYLAPVGIALVGAHVLGERLTPRVIGALGLALVGTTLVARPRGGQGAGMVWAAVAAASFVALVVASKPLAEAYGGLRTSFMEMTGAGLVLIPVALQAHWSQPASAWGWLVVLGLVHTALLTAGYLACLAEVPATSVGILGYLEPASVVVFGWLFLSQRPGPLTIAGGVLIVIGGALVITEAAAAEEVSLVVPR
jgi:drug/metabolite transporter (DMT)-like permease